MDYDDRSSRGQKRKRNAKKDVKEERRYGDDGADDDGNRYENV